jgi:HD-GYP domain-containing protein (c-di-GMP phosphodiesterase class II)
MTNDRPYRKAMEPAAAVKIIRKNAGTQFNPKIADIFADLMMSKS